MIKEDKKNMAIEMLRAAKNKDHLAGLPTVDPNQGGGLNTQNMALDMPAVQPDPMKEKKKALVIAMLLKKKGK